MGQTVLGIDAAWTEHQPSGLALLQGQGEGWRSLAVAPSYESFLALAEGTPVDWSARPQGSPPAMAELLRAAEHLAGQPMDCIAIDMPLSTEKINGRRAADREVSRLFGSRGCSVHSPNAERPGSIANKIRPDLQNLSYPLHTTGDRPGPGGVIEVYPHVALLALLQVDYRVPYKVSRSQRYWPGLPVPERIRRLLENFKVIRDALSQRIEAITLPLPEPDQVTSMAALKTLEDSLDALVCAWVAIEHLAERTSGLGDATAAIWCPSAT
jgi:predicted RNase H-like nuclease